MTKPNSQLLIQHLNHLNNESEVWRLFWKGFSRLWNMDSIRICNWDRLVVMKCTE